MNFNSGRKYSTNREGRGGPRKNRWNDNQQRSSSFNRMQGNQVGLLGNRPMVSPWESGVAPGMQMQQQQSQGGILSTFAQPSSFMSMQSSSGSSSSFGGSNFSSMSSPNKMRRVERETMGGINDQRGRGLLPSPTTNPPLLGAAPTSFGSVGREPYIQQRLGGNLWNSSFQSNLSKGISGSSYFPSDTFRGGSSMRQPFRNNPIKERLDRSNNSNRNRVRSKRPIYRSRLDSKHSDESNDKTKDLKKEKPHWERSNDSEKEAKVDKKESNEDENEALVKEDQEENQDSTLENQDNATDNKEGDQKKQEDNFPAAALYCHICELDKFTSKKGYVRHLQGLTHAKMAELFHANNAATLELLNASAKLADMRQRDKNLRKTGIRGQQLNKTTEQLLLQRWLRVRSCCGTKFKSQFEMEEHKLSLNHLKTAFEAKQKKEADQNKLAEENGEEPETEASRDAILESFNVIQKAIDEQKEEPLSSKSLMPYNPSNLFGVHCMTRYLKFRCSICKGPLAKNLEEHCQSHRHYNMIVEAISKEEEAERKRIKDEKNKEETKEKVEESQKVTNDEPTEVNEPLQEEPEEEPKEDDEEELDSQDPNADYIMVDCSDESPKPKEQQPEEDEDKDMDEENILDEVAERIEFDVLELENEIAAAPQLALEESKEEEEVVQIEDEEEEEDVEEEEEVVEKRAKRKQPQRSTPSRRRPRRRR